ncbi:matrix-remodeling-associated protein 5-like [Antennarius striatus]|uniref:matrix-remodeling-associated protein 5-like n=1 Tax=Antennarius striatus TaxID=241820 RepID=UPI0035B08F29
MHQSACALPALLALLVLILELPSGQACPRSCNCYQANEVHCTFRSLLSVPPGLPVHSRRINLGFNSISRIRNSSLAGLKKTELLMLHSNDLHHLPDAVFRDMKTLQILKLSYNKLREISSPLIFSGLTSLLRLYLDHNLLQHIHPRALLQLPSLKLLRLQGNKLHQLHPHALCTLSLLNTFYFSTLRHIDLSNNSLTTLPRETLMTAPLLDTLVLNSNPWSCDCRMNWFLAWTRDHPGLMKCPSGPNCPICGSPDSIQGLGLLEQMHLSCGSPVISSQERVTPSEMEISEIQSRDFFREPLGSVSLDLSDHQGNKVDLRCNIIHSSDSQDVAPPPDLSLSSSSPLPLALSLSLECPVEREDYEKLWRTLAYYSETAVRLEREIMLSKAPTLAYRYKQAAETDGHHHTGVEASVEARPHWLLQPFVSIQLNRAKSNRHKVNLIYSTRVSAKPNSTNSGSSPSSHTWVLISTNQTMTALAAVTGSKVVLPCPIISSGNPKVWWILPDGSNHTSSSNSKDGRLRTSMSGLQIQTVQPSDAGIYYCAAHVNGDVDVLPLRLVVEESSVPPVGEQVGPPLSGITGEPINLPCKASGSPVPHLSWMLPDGSMVWSGSVMTSRLTVQSNGSLSLPNPSQMDTGHYRCIVVNQYGSDSLSMQLELHSKQSPPLGTSFPRGPQSASGRSTRIRAPFHQMEEGSGNEKEDEERTLGNRKEPRLFQSPPNRGYPNGIPRRRLPTREGLLRRGGPATNQRRNRFENRHRVTANKQRIDPQKWADLLAKIRQKTTNTDNAQLTTAGTPTAKQEGSSKGEDTGNLKEHNDTDTERTEESKMEAESEGSSVGDSDLQEEHLQPLPTVFREIKTHSETNTDIEIKKGMLSLTDPPPVLENEADTDRKTEKEVTQTEMVTDPTTRKQLVTSKPLSERRDTVSEPVEETERKANLKPSRTRPQKPRQRLSPNLVPNSQSQNPLNPRRRIGQRRRIINRHRGQPLSPPQPLPDPTNPQSITPKPTTDQTIWLLPLTTMHPGILLTQRKAVALNTVPSTAASPSSLTSLSPKHLAKMTHSANIPDTGDSTHFSTPPPVPTQSSTVITQTTVLDTDASTHTHVIQTHTKTHTTLGQHVDRPSSKHSEDLERNWLVVPYVSQPTSSSPSTPSSSVPGAATTTTSAKITTPTTHQSTDSAKRVGNTKSMVDTHASPTVNPMTRRSITLTTTTTIIPTSSTARSGVPVPSTTASFTSTTTTTPDLPFITATNTMSTVTSTANSYILLTSPDPSTTTVTIKTTAPNYVRMSPAPKSTTTPNKPSTTMRTIRSTTASSKESVEARGKQVPGSPNQSRFPTDWKNPAANSIPDSHSSRPWRPPSPSLPAAPRAPVVRSRPRIADPHIRAVSFSAESTARLACEARGEPKPFITWTKVATGAVMSIHSRAQRFEVLPNGTLVIQKVQLQDRGTYICSAQSFLGRDRILTTLEVWTRPPRMRLPSYRESTVHQGGEVHLDCQADGVPTPLLSWVLPDRSVLTFTAPRTSHVTMDTNGTLHIPVALQSDRGVYRCVASNSAGAASASVRVHVSSLPPVIQLPREEHLLLSLGRPVYAHCSARGAPPPTLRWRIPDGTLVRPSQFLHDNLFVLPNGTLHIRKVGPKDTGNYECTASNAVGADKRTVRVEIEEGERRQGGARIEGVKADVTVKPSSSSLSKDKTLSVASQPSNPYSLQRLSPHSPFEGSRTSQLIPSHSHSSHIHKPRPTVSITHLTKINKTKPSALSPPSTGPTINSPVSATIINNTRATSSSDKSKASAVLHPLPVSPLSKARIVSSSPSFTTIHHGVSLQLHCSVTGNPPPIIIWRTPNRKLVDMNFSFDRRLKVHPNGTLMVQAATEKDAGDYLCITRNKLADDYRLLRVSVATTPAKIEPKQPLNQMVLFGKPLQVDCQASGLPDPAVHWKLPDGTTVNSVLQGEHRGGRSRRLTVFDNGTLLVPAVGVGEEGEYTCYAENQGGQDSMKVKVKVMMTSPPTFSDDGRYHVIKVRQGATATIHCRATGDPAPVVTWFSPARRSIPQSSRTGFYYQRLVVLSNGTLEVRLAQKIDTGNYTCRASNSAGERSMAVGLEVESPNFGLSRQVEGRSWTAKTGPGIGHKSGDSIDSARIIQSGFTNGVTGKLNISIDNNNDDNGRDRNLVPQPGINTATAGFNPALRSDSQNGISRTVSGITTQHGSTVIHVALDKNTGIKADNIGINRNGPGIRINTNNVANSHSTVRGYSADRNSETDNNDVITGKATNNENTNQNSGLLHGIFRYGRVHSSSASNNDTGTHRGNGFSQSGGVGVSDDYTRNRGSLSSTGITASNTSRKNSTNIVVGTVATVKLQAMKGQTLLLSCPSQGSPPPRVSWLLPGNGVLPAPYYGSRLTVHRNGSLELRGVRVSDGGTLMCVVKGERDEKRIQVELEVSELKEETRSLHRGHTGERPVQENVSSSEAPRSATSLDSTHSLNVKPVFPERLHPRIPVTQKPLYKGPPLLSAHQPAGPPPRSAGTLSAPAVSTRTAPLVSIINGETLRLLCTDSQSQGLAQASLTWTTPSGKVLSRGEDGDSGRYFVREDGTLTVQQASVFDRGTYTCRSTSFDSSSVSAITVPVIVIAYPPRITMGPSPVTYTRTGVAVELPCLTIATPRATITWETPDLIRLKTMAQPRVYGNRYLSPQGSLVIQNPTGRDTGFYRCTANNVIGVDSKTTYLHVL